MVANDDLEGKTTHFTGFYTHTISGPNIPKPPIVVQNTNYRALIKINDMGIALGEHANIIPNYLKQNIEILTEKIRQEWQILFFRYMID